MNWSERILVIAVVVAVPVCLIVLPLYLLFGGLRTFALRPLQRCFAGIDLHEALQPGDVSFTYHTYRGLILWSTMDEHRVIAPAEDALRLLKRLLRFNLTWGLLSYGQLLIPFLAIGSYQAQIRSIKSQMKAAESPAGPVTPPAQ